MSVTPLLVHIAEFITLLLIVLAAYKIVINYNNTINTDHNTPFDIDTVDSEVHTDTANSALESAKNDQPQPKQKRDAVLNDYIGDFF